MEKWFRQVVRFLTPPVLEDEDRTRAARLLHILLLTVAVGTALYFALTFLAQPQMLSQFPIAVAAIVIAVAMLYVLRRGIVTEVAYLFLLFFWLLLTYSAYISGGIGTPAFYSYVIVVMIAGLVLGLRQAIAFGLLCAGAASALYALEIQNALPPYEPYSHEAILIFNIAFFLVSAGLIGVAIQDARRSLARLRQSQQALRISNRAYHTLSDCNQVLVRATSEAQLLADICRTIVETGGYRMAWVGYAQQDAERSIAVMASAGHEAGYLALHPLSWAEGAPNPTAAAFAIQSGQLYEFQIHAQSADQPVFWHSAGVERGYRSGIALPLKNEDKVLGALSIYSSENDVFTTEEIHLLDELAADLSFGIAALRARAERQQAENRFRKIFEASPVGIFITSLMPLADLEANNALVELIGYTLAEVYSGDVEFFRSQLWIHPEDREQLLEAAVREGSVSNAEVQWRTKAGAVIDVLLSMDRIELNGEPCLLGMVVDITERKRAEARNRYLAYLLENISDAIISTDGSRRIASWNKAAERIYGWKAEEVIGQVIAPVLKSEFKAETREEVFAQIEREGRWTGDLIQHHKDGRPLNIRSSIARLPAGEGMVAVNRDVTARVQAEAALRQMQERLQTVISYMPITLFSTDRQGIITLSEGRGLEALDLKPGQLVGSSIFEVYRDLPDVLEMARDALAGRAGTWLGQLADRYYESRMTPLYDHAGQVEGLLGLAMDVTDRLVVEEELIKAQRLQAELEREREILKIREDFIGVVSHQFRTPLTVILSSNELMERYYDRLDDARRHKYLRQIREQVAYMTGLIDDMLLISRARSGRLEFNPAPMDLESFCRAAVEQMAFSDANQHQLSFTSEGDFENLLMDATLLQHIISNLLSNAVKYTPAGKAIEVMLREEHGEAVIVVRDEGVGIPVEDQARLFEPFHRAANVREIRGTGLGLAIVLDSVTAHGGVIECDSQENVGTTFTVRLPMRR